MRKLLSFLWKGWIAFAHAIGTVNTYVILTLFYAIVLAPYGIVSLLQRMRASAEKPTWVRSTGEIPSLEELKRTF